MFTIYARKEKAIAKGRQDVMIYADKEAKNRISCYPWHYMRSKPTKRHKNIMHDCNKYHLEWLDDLK